MTSMSRKKGDGVRFEVATAGGAPEPNGLEGGPTNDVDEVVDGGFGVREEVDGRSESRDHWHGAGSGCEDVRAGSARGDRLA
jgi:hypothetical protein